MARSALALAKKDALAEEFLLCGFGAVEPACNVKFGRRAGNRRCSSLLDWPGLAGFGPFRVALTLK